MYVPAHFSFSDINEAHSYVRKNMFATVAGSIGDNIHLAYVPVIIESEPEPFGTARLHFAAGNPLADLEDGEMLTMSFLGPHAYVSPDWYETTGLVPTWNYIAAEAKGRAYRLDDTQLRNHLERLLAEQELRLAPKAPWSVDRLRPDQLKNMLARIAGFRVDLESLEGKAKLSQNRSNADVLGVISSLEGLGDPMSRSVAALMQKHAR